MKVLKVTHSRLQVERIFPELYKELCDEVLETDSHMLSTYEDIEKNFINPKDVRMYWRDLVVDIETDSENIRVKMKRLLYTDYGSTPKKVRSIVDNDDLDMLMAYLVHDAWFGANKGFTFANKLFRAMLKYYGVGFFVRHGIYLSVSSWKGKSAYRKTQYQRSKARQFIEIIRNDKK